MGLDVSLYHCKDVKAFNAYDKEQSDAHETIYQELKKELNLSKDEYFSADQTQEWTRRYEAWDKENPPPCQETPIDQKSKIHPEHMFTIGYMRSSYNNSGTNSILRAATGKDLYTIFRENGNKDYRFTPDWNKSLELAKQVRGEYRGHLNRVGPVKVISIDPIFSLQASPTSSEAAMRLFEDQQKRHNERFADGKKEPFATKDQNWYSNGDGSYFLGDGARLLAAIPGQGVNARPTTYLVIRDGDEDITKNWYLQALDVVVEICEWVLNQENPQEFCMHWSA